MLYEVITYFDARLDIVLDGGPVPNTPSSVISLVEDEPEILRYGAGEIDVFE